MSDVKLVECWRCEGKGTISTSWTWKKKSFKEDVTCPICEGHKTIVEEKA